MATHPGLDSGSAPPSKDLPPSYDATQVGKETKSSESPVAQQPPPMIPSPFPSPQLTTGYPQGYPQQPQASPMSDQGQPSIQYVVSTPFPMIANSPKPGYPGPHYFVIYVVVATVICGFLNPLSLMFSMAALICMAMASHNSSTGQYPKASILGTAAFILTNLAVVFTMLLWISLVGVIVGYTDGANHCYSIYYDRDDGYTAWCY